MLLFVKIGSKLNWCFIFKILKRNSMGQIFLTYDAKTNIQDQEGNTALHYCVEVDNWLIIEILLKYGSNPDIKNKRVRIEFDYMFKKPFWLVCSTFQGQNAIDTAYEYKNFEAADTIKSFMEEKKLNPKVQDFFLDLYPSIFLLYLGCVFQSSISYLFKFVLLAAWFFKLWMFKK